MHRLLLRLVIGVAFVPIPGCGDSAATPDPAPEPERAAPQIGVSNVTQDSKLSAGISDRVDELFRAIHEQPVERVYNTFTSPKFREVASLEKFQELCDRSNERLGALESKELSEFATSPFSGTIAATGLYNAKFELGSGVIYIVFEKADGQWQLLRLNVQSPRLNDGEPSSLFPTELLVEDSELVSPGSKVDFVDVSVDPPAVVLENVFVKGVRWRLAGPFTKPKAPATGFVQVNLSTEQMEAVGTAKKLSVRTHQE